MDTQKEAERGKRLKTEVLMDLGELPPKDILAEAYYHPVDSKANLLTALLYKTINLYRLMEMYFIKVKSLVTRLDVLDLKLECSLTIPYLLIHTL